jgi:hypothetical protein
LEQNTRFQNASGDKGRRLCVEPHSENPGVAKQKQPFALCSAKLQKDGGLGHTRRDLQKDIHAGHKCLTKSIDYDSLCHHYSHLPNPRKIQHEIDKR